MADQTRQIFIFTAGTRDAQEHLDASIRNPIAPEQILSLFPPDERPRIQTFEKAHGLYSWGAVPGQQNTPRWKALQEDDWVLCVFQDRYQYVGRVLGKYDNEDFAKKIWGIDETGQTWQLMYFLTRPSPVSVPVAEVANYLWNRYMGFSRIGDSNLEKIRRDFGSVDNFMNEVFLKGDRVSNEKDRAHFLIRSNRGSEWRDEEGQLYRFGSTVPNYTHLLNGGYVIVDSRTDEGVRLIGFGTLDKAVETGKYQRESREGKNYEARFTEWHAFEHPREIDSPLREEIQALPGYNNQHAIRPITKQIYDRLLAAIGDHAVAREASPMKELVTHCDKFIASRGFTFAKTELANIVLSIKTKPFVILAGISGTGKSRLVQLLAEAISAHFELIPVKPDWSDNTDLIGYEDFQQQFRPAKLVEVLVRAHEYPAKPHFILLDEMNLARVEHYFSDFLSVIETRRRDERGNIVTSPIIKKDISVTGSSKTELTERYIRDGLTIPSNVYVFGTVNMDETTHPFSRKVLDRANTVEFSDIRLAFNVSERQVVKPMDVSNESLVAPYLTLSDVYEEQPEFFDSIIDGLNSFNGLLERKGLHVGYRLRDEVCFYMYLNYKSDLMSRDLAFDYQIHQKILPRVHGGEEVREILEGVRSLCEGKYPKSERKAQFMLERLSHGFTSFWL